LPEGPEILVATEYVRSVAKDERVINASVGKTSRYKHKFPLGFVQFAAKLPHKNIRVTDIQCKGKFQYWTFSNEYYMFITFGMSGQWYPEEKKHTCIELGFGEFPFDPAECSLYFNDPRHFGTVKFIKNKQMLLKKLNNLGWDPLSEPLNTYQKQIYKTIKNSSKTLAQLLMDQSNFSGVGNYLKCEVLHRSCLSPWRLGNTLSETEISFLCQNINNVMHESYSYGGSTIATYQTPDGKRGDFADYFRVYGREYDPQNNPVIKELTLDKRSTYWCPNLQK